MIKNKYIQQEEVLLSEDGILSVKHRDYINNAEKCSQCGFELLPGEEVVEIHTNGELIHKSCWCEYADENLDIFGSSFFYSDGSFSN